MDPRHLSAAARPKAFLPAVGVAVARGPYAARPGHRTVGRAPDGSAWNWVQASLRTFCACRPFGPFTTSNSTFCPSAKVRKPSALIAVWWQNTSSPPPSCVMKPKPFVSLNHFTVPVAIRRHPSSKRVGGNGRVRRRGSRPRARAFSYGLPRRLSRRRRSRPAKQVPSDARAGHFAERSDEHLPPLGSVGRPDDAVALHPLDHPRRPVVPDPQLALQQRDGDEAHVGERRDGLVVQLVRALVVLGNPFAVLGTRPQDGRVVDRRALRLPVLDHRVALLLLHVRPVPP